MRDEEDLQQQHEQVNLRWPDAQVLLQVIRQLGYSL